MGSRVTVRLEDSLTSLPKQLQSQIRKITEKHVNACNMSNGRLKDSNFDITYIDYVSHYFTWLEVNKNLHNMSLLDQHNRNVPWHELKAISEDTINAFFINFVQNRRTQPKTTKKYVSALQSYTTHIEKIKNNITLLARG